MTSARIFALAIALSVLAPSLTAQCANGSPPPCGTPASPRADPKLDDRRWIVLPFRNIARAADLDWVSEASGTLLSVDMLNWTDLHVVVTERVVDLLRDVPASRQTQLSLQDGLSVAKHAGAGKLVMGEYLREGGRVTVTAKVFDVRTGAVVRSVGEPPIQTDSISVAYRRLAPRVLDLPTPVGTTLTGVGTLSTEALRSYVLGTQALNRGRTDSAKAHLLRAIAIDSTFALAHMQLVATAVYAAADSAIASRARAAATRFSRTLPERERILIALAQSSVDLTTRCSYGRRLLALDSADAAAWMAMGRCDSDNTRLVPDTGELLRREASLNAARYALERSLELKQDPNAILLLPNLQAAWNINGCAIANAYPAQCPAASMYWGALVFESDTLIARFERRNRFDPPWRRPEFAAGRRAKETALRDVLMRWVAANPENIYGHTQLGMMLLNMGEFAEAGREFSAGSEVLQLEGARRRALVYGFRAEIEWKLGRPERAATLLDSTETTWPEYNVAFGQFRRAAEGARAALRPLAAAFSVAYTGIVSPDFAQTVRAYAAAADTAHRNAILEDGTALGFHTLRTGPALDTASAFPLFRFQAFLARGDSARARTALAEYDAWGARGVEDYWDAHEMFSAESHLELGDTATAWMRIEPFGRRWPQYSIRSDWASTWFNERDGNPSARVLGRAWLLYADLAMATGHKDEARRGYKMIVGMWEKGDPPVQPLVARAKAVLAKLGGP